MTPSGRIADADFFSNKNGNFAIAQRSDELSLYENRADHDRFKHSKYSSVTS